MLLWQQSNADKKMRRCCTNAVRIIWPEASAAPVDKTTISWYSVKAIPFSDGTNNWDQCMQEALHNSNVTSLIAAEIPS